MCLDCTRHNETTTTIDLGERHEIWSLAAGECQSCGRHRVWASARTLAGPGRVTRYLCLGCEADHIEARSQVPQTVQITPDTAETRRRRLGQLREHESTVPAWLRV